LSGAILDGPGGNLQSRYHRHPPSEHRPQGSAEHRKGELVHSLPNEWQAQDKVVEVEPASLRPAPLPESEHADEEGRDNDEDLAADEVGEGQEELGRVGELGVEVLVHLGKRRDDHGEQEDHHGGGQPEEDRRVEEGGGYLLLQSDHPFQVVRVSGEGIRQIPALFADPERGDVEWGEDLWVLGCRVRERRAAFYGIADPFQDLPKAGLGLPFDDEVEDRGDRKAGFDQRKELLVENQEVFLSDPAPGGEGNTEGQVGTPGSNLENIVTFCFKLVP
jgi:hypothetical protein